MRDLLKFIPAVPALAFSTTVTAQSIGTIAYGPAGGAASAAAADAAPVPIPAVWLALTTLFLGLAGYRALKKGKGRTLLGAALLMGTATLVSVMPSEYASAVASYIEFDSPKGGSVDVPLFPQEFKNTSGSPISLANVAVPASCAPEGAVEHCATGMVLGDGKTCTTSYNCSAPAAPGDYTLVLGNPDGSFHAIDPATGATSALFTLQSGGSSLGRIRAFTYHYAEKAYFVSVDSKAGGDLYRADPVSKQAFKINDNDGSDGQAIWDAVVNWAEGSNGKLISLGDFNADGNGIVEFDTDGTRALTLERTNTCCGLGLVFDSTAGVFTVANGWSTNDGEIQIDQIAVGSGGTIVPVANITNMVGFPKDLSTDWLPVRSLAGDPDGTLYGLMYNYDESDTYFISIDIAGGSATYIATLATSGADAPRNLTYLPNFLLP
jgi:hypothetical protein